MQNFVNFIKENYSYFVYAFEFVLALVGAVFAFIHSLRCRKVSSKYDRLNDVSRDFCKQIDFFTFLPHLIAEANVLYPVHGDGEKRFQYVYHKSLQILNAEPSDRLFRLISECIDDVLKADKLEKISRDTLVQEPKKEFSYEKKEDETIERSQDLCQDGKEDKSVECSARYVSRRD